ncbi:MAG: MauE/DoxX family redox-associated membrane protein [Pseudomonadota bacterium]
MTSWTTWRGHAVLGMLARVYLGLVFVVACLHKIAEPASFAMDIATYQLLPLPLINLLAITLPWVELVAGLLLILGLRVRGAALLVAGMMVLFIAALGWALASDLTMSCGCFASQGVKADPISHWTLLRDLGWLVLSVYVLLLDRHPLGLDHLLAPRAQEAS